uniref:Uncharacterized protein n=1 Tax=Rhizoctonia cerealis orthocurvulavirus TaxID=3068670 RepID=A0AA51BS91_9VIRU|nr:MAG: hypothetical protein [Rhizoctonia cerealis orthocurvulavirus]
MGGFGDADVDMWVPYLQKPKWSAEARDLMRSCIEEVGDGEADVRGSLRLGTRGDPLEMVWSEEASVAENILLNWLDVCAPRNEKARSAVILAIRDVGFRGVLNETRLRRVWDKDVVTLRS